MTFSLHVENFRGIKSADWTLDGICVLVGPNGVGKSTFLQALEFFHEILADGPGHAIRQGGGAALVKNLSASPSDELVLKYQTEQVIWEVRLTINGSGLQPPMAETVRLDGRLVLEQKPGVSTLTAFGTQVESADTSGVLTAIRHNLLREVLPLGDLLWCQIFRDPSLSSLRAVGSQASTDVTLSSNADNLFAVLRNWRGGERQHRLRMEFVDRGLRDAFPDLYEDLDFEAAGQTVTARFYRPGSSKPIPIFVAPNGLIAGMIHLAAVASSNEGIVGIDEFENSLHPRAIRKLVGHMRDWASARNITVVLASHSPVLLNEFKNDPAHVFAMEKPFSSPTRLDELRDPEWLAQFSLGDLYSNEEIGAPSAQ